jgi:hypothetical protein
MRLGEMIEEILNMRDQIFVIATMIIYPIALSALLFLILKKLWYGW